MNELQEMLAWYHKYRCFCHLFEAFLERPVYIALPTSQSGCRARGFEIAGFFVGRWYRLAFRNGMLTGSAQYNIVIFYGETMSLQESVKGELKVAMKAKDSDRTWAIRVLMGEFGRQTEKELSDEQVVAIIKKLIKSERELLAAKGQDGSPFLTIMEEYLPKAASEEEIRAWIEGNLDFSTFANRMQAMRPIMNHFGSAADGNVVKKILMSYS